MHFLLTNDTKAERFKTYFNHCYKDNHIWTIILTFYSKQLPNFRSPGGGPHS